MHLISPFSSIRKLNTQKNEAQNDVLPTIRDRKYRSGSLRRAQILGNLYRQKVKIKFRDAQHEAQELITKVWSVTEKYVIVQGNKMIPINTVMEVELH